MNNPALVTTVFMLGSIIGFLVGYRFFNKVLQASCDTVKRLREALPKHELLPARKPGDTVKMHALKMGNGKLMYEVREEVFSRLPYDRAPTLHIELIKNEYGETRWEDYSRAMVVYEKRHAEVLAETIIFDVPLTIRK